MKLKYELAVVTIVGISAFLGNLAYGKRLDDVEKELGELQLENNHLKIELDILRDDARGLALYNRLKVGSIPTFSENEKLNSWAEHYCNYFDQSRFFEH